MSTVPEIMASPLDVVRDRIGLIGRYDSLLATADLSEVDEVRLEAFRNIGRLSQGFPIIGQRVSVLGREVVPDPVLMISDDVVRIDDDGIERPAPMRFSAGIEEMSLVKGILRGFCIEDVVDLDNGPTPRILYELETGREFFRNFTRQAVNIVTYNWATVSGSGVMPIEPINAHSMTDLASDETVELIDRIIKREQAVEDVRIQTASEYLNRLFASKRATNGRAHQLVSYFNSFELVRGRKITARDFIVGFPTLDQEHTIFPVSDVEETCLLDASHFTLLPSYDRTQSEEVDTAIATDTFEVYVRARTTEGRNATVPASQIIEIC